MNRRDLLKLAPLTLAPAASSRALTPVARLPRLTLFHCHIQSHMDYGFKALFRYA